MYRKEGYGHSRESRLAQQARLNDRAAGVAGNGRKNTYGGTTFKDRYGNTHEVDGKSNADHHAENDMMKKMREKIAAERNARRAPGEPEIRQEDVDLRTEASDVKMYVEYSPCPTGNRCQDLIDEFTPGADVSYSWGWQPESVRDAAKVA
ncbi:hypothetical protein [Actinoplanes sp. NPDC051851]|uniref:hypothetical protein n=1 Tax=Actinoplanes sp. NPDC051851 TaxID=3154753 RepID=UPI00342EA2A7